jgi:Predicted ATPase
MKINGVLHIYTNGLYKAGSAAIEKAMIKHIPNLRAAQRAEVLKYIGITAESYKHKNNSQYIAFTNGILDLSTRELIDFTPDIVITNGIPHAYNPAAESDIVDDVLRKLSVGDENVENLLSECVGYCMYRSNEIAGGKAFILTGDKANGKSTFLDCFIGNVLGEETQARLTFPRSATVLVQAPCLICLPTLVTIFQTNSSPGDKWLYLRK